MSGNSPEDLEHAFADAGISPEAGDIPAEWFDASSDGDDYDFEDPAATAKITRSHFVSTVIVAHNGATWLPAVLTTISRATRPPEVIVGVDAASSDRSAEILTEALGPDRVLTLTGNHGFGAAVARGIESIPRPELSAAATGDPRSSETIEWVWLLHDDSAPDPTCLEQLLIAADSNQSAGILGPKILGWHDRRLLLEVGVSVTPDGRRFTGLERREHDQGQHDGTRDSLAVSSAGMLIRRDIWDRLEGFNPQLPLFRDDLDFCWRAHRAGERVLVVPEALLHHREASAHGRRSEQSGDSHAGSLAKADRAAAVHVLLTHSKGIRAFGLALRILVGSTIRSLVSLLGKDVAGARAEIGAVFSVLVHPGRLRDSRALAARSAVESSAVTRHLRPTTWDQLRGVLEAAAGLATTSNAQTTSLSALDSGPVDDDAAFLDGQSTGLLRRVIRKPSVILVAILTLLAIIATRSLWLGEGVVQGGALLPSPWGVSDLWGTYLQGWHNVGPGSTADAPPYLAVLAIIGTLFLGKATVAVQVLVLLAIPMAGWAAYFASRDLIASKGIRFWAAATYALIPAMTGALAQGRIGTSVLAIVLPFAIRSLVRMFATTVTLRRTAGTSILLAVMLAFAPVAWLIALVAVAVAGGVRIRSLRRVALLALLFLASFALLIPWSFSLIFDPVRWLLEPGLNSTNLIDPDISMLDAILLHPGGPGMTPLWVTVGIVVAAVLALLRTDQRSITLMWWVLAGIAALFALVQVMFLFTPPGQSVAVRTWPGPATLIISLAMIAAIAVGGQGLRTRFIGQSFSWGQPIAVAAVAGAVVAPVLSAGWLAPAAGDLLQRISPATVPAFVAADAFSPQAPRTLVLLDNKAGRVTYTVINGDGMRLGDADLTPAAEIYANLDPYVADMASGRGGEEIEVLGGYGIRYVILAQGSARDLVPTLDAEPGLRRLSSADGEVLWRVAGVTSRARISDGEAFSPVGIAQPDVLGTNPYIDQALPEGGGTRVLYLGTPTDSRWQADSGSGLEPVVTDSALSWSATFALPAGSPQARIIFDDSSRTLWLLGQLVAVIIVIVIALPSRTREELDPDAEALIALDIASHEIASHKASRT